MVLAVVATALTVSEGRRGATRGDGDGLESSGDGGADRVEEQEDRYWLETMARDTGAM